MINQGTILGRVGKINVTTTSGGMKIANISMVTSKKVTRNGQKEEKVTWHNVTAFNKIAEISESYVSVGDLLYVQGEMENQKWTDKDGIEKTKYFLIVHDLKLMPKSKEHKAAPKEELIDQAFDDNVPW